MHTYLLRLPLSLWRQVRIRCVREDVTVRALIERLLREWITASATR